MIVIDSWENEAVRTDDALGQLKIWLLRQIRKPSEVIGFEGEPVTEENIDAQIASIVAAGVLCEYAFDGFLVLTDDDEGSEGVAVGFSSADRNSFAMPWPEARDDDEFLGNGDPMVYKIAGVPEGTVVRGHEEI
jgi:hypothetical protein